MCSDFAIQVDNLSKSYQIYNKPSDRLKQFVYPSIKRLVGKPIHNYFQNFWALQNINFAIPKGETVGVIGKNGSGKSTLLQIICGTLTPTSGTVQTQGRIGALLELGSGFNPEFTGLENVYLNAAVLGLKKEEIEAKLDDILSFADIGNFIHQPVKKYSSGMGVRLAFAVQAQIDPDILIVDEALAVGDARFQAKCFSRLKKLKENGTSILLVTHASDQIVTHCSYALLLNNGEQISQGDPKSVVNQYHDIIFGKTSPKVEASVTPIIKGSNLSTDQGNNDSLGSSIRKTHFDLSLTEDKFYSHLGYNQHEYRWGDGKARIIDYLLVQDDTTYPHSVVSGSVITLVLNILFLEPIYRPILGLTIKNKEGQVVYGSNTEITNSEARQEFQIAGQKGTVVQSAIQFQIDLASADYFISVGVASQQENGPEPHDRRYDSIHLLVEPTPTFFGVANLKANFLNTTQL